MARRIGRDPSGHEMKYLTTLEVAHELKVSKQTLLNWLYAGKVPEPPRNRKGYRLWSPSRVSLVKKLIGDGRLHRRTVVHRRPPTARRRWRSSRARSTQFLRDGQIELQRVPARAAACAAGHASAAAAPTAPAPEEEPAGALTAPFTPRGCRA